MSTVPKRMPAAERRESILGAAAEVFGRRGYAGATTDAIAQVAGISQAYVVRTFGSKEALFIATAERAIDHVVEAFRAVIAAEGTTGARIEPKLGEAYVPLAEDHGVLVTLLHLFTLGQDPVIGPVARDGFLRIHRLLRDEAGLSPARATAFLGRGLLVSTLFGLQLPAHADDPAVGELLESTFRENAPLVATLFDNRDGRATSGS